MTINSSNNSLPSGFEISQYTVHNVISRSNSTITYTATDQTSRNYFIKEYYPEAISKRLEDGSVEPLSEKEHKNYQDGLTYFKDLGLTLTKIEHRNIVKINELLVQHGTIYLVSHYEEGITLAEIFKQTEVIDEEDITNIVFPMLKGLMQLHEANIFHLAIRPENVLIKSNGTPILLGFGSVPKYIFNDGSSINKLNSGYTPIEQYPEQSEQRGDWSDIYALGALLYHCISGERPPESIERMKSLENRGVDILKPAQEIGKEKYQDHILAAIDHALQIHPKDRPKTIKEWTQQFIKISYDKDQYEKYENESNPVENTNLVKKQNRIKQREAIHENLERQRKRWEAYLGGKEQTYYMSKFLNQDGSGKFPKASWNWAAFIFNVLWLMYRKMYFFTLVALPILSIAFIYLAHYFIENNLVHEEYFLINPTIDHTIIAYYLFTTLFICIFGNYLYFLHVSFKSHSSEKKYADLSRQRKWLSKKGGTTYVAPLFAIIALSFGISYGYEYLSNEDKIAQQQINSGIMALKYTANKVKAFKIRENRWPKNAKELSNHTLSDQYKYVENIYIKNKLIIVTFQHNDVVSNIADKSIALFATESEDGGLNWLCGSINIPLEHLPLECKRKLK